MKWVVKHADEQKHETDDVKCEKGYAKAWWRPYDCTIPSPDSEVDIEKLGCTPAEPRKGIVICFRAVGSGCFEREHAQRRAIITSTWTKFSWTLGL